VGPLVFLKNVVFLFKKIRYNKKMVTEADIMDRLKRGELSLPPLSLKIIDVELGKNACNPVNAMLQASWGDKRYKFVLEVKSIGTPKIMQNACNQSRLLARPPETYPMVVVPYLSPKQISELEKQEVSGIDLSGNGIMIIPNEILIIRSGERNRFRKSDPIKNIYRGNSSLVARAFLLKPKFSAVKEILEFIRSRGGNITFSTISKALKILEEDLVISREKDKIKLIQADKLLDQLVESYIPPRIKEKFMGRCETPPLEIIQNIKLVAQSYNARLTTTGAGAADKYAVMAREPVLSLYCSESPSMLLAQTSLKIETTGRFVNLEIFETDDERVYFDIRDQAFFPYSSPCQVYLELMRGDKRQREIADQLNLLHHKGGGFS
jgi:hypothetical protein